jgi:phosphoribosyl-ATP pyrophosphohydrolase
MEKRHAINKPKQTEESLSTVNMEKRIERERTLDVIAEATQQLWYVVVLVLSKDVMLHSL